jgi:hypothetical protein
MAHEMIKLFLDYFNLNRRRIRNDLLTIYIGALVLEGSLLLQTHPDFSSALMVRSFLIAIATFPAAAVVVYLFHGIAAYSILLVLARDAGLSMSDYLASPQYQQEGKSKLKRGQGRKLFV